MDEIGTSVLFGRLLSEPADVDPLALPYPAFMVIA
jgi:hypothetical protein